MHSPKPWEINHYTNYFGYSISGRKRKDDSYIGCISERWYASELNEKENIEMRANARLISAAPELLAICKEIEGDGRMFNELDASTAKKLQESIEMAEGKILNGDPAKIP